MISLGIDTSCYTTSLAVLEDDKIRFEKRVMLTVKKGTVGLRQADAFFQHVQNLPKLYHDLKESVKLNFDQVVVSSRPRPLDDSYMPVFTAGERFAEVISDSLDIPLVKISHQENHLFASLIGQPLKGEFLGVHISGGTSEILSVNKQFDIEIIGETLDLSMGKLIDRIGVHMGFDFPCGKAMDAYQSDDIYPLKKSLKECSFNISGIENQLKKYYNTEQNVAKICVSLFTYLGELLVDILKKALIKTGYHNIIMSGGVSANSTIRRILKAHFGKRVIFTDVKYATDHSVGNAYYGNVVKTYQT